MIRKPVLSEKSLQGATLGKFTFEVDLKDSKKQIAAEVEKLFKVDVVAVRTRILKGKRVRVRGTVREHPGPRIKKATVTLVPGQKIPIFEAS